MKAPTCRLCGAAHWMREPHVWGKVVAPVVTDMPVTHAPSRNAPAVTHDLAVTRPQWQRKHADNAARQREYRKRKQA